MILFKHMIDHTCFCIFPYLMVGKMLLVTRLDGSSYLGNSLSLFLVRLSIKRFETKTSHDLQCFHRLWLRYVDDVLQYLLQKNQMSVSLFHSSINTIIKFTFEDGSKEYQFHKIFILHCLSDDFLNICS